MTRTLATGLKTVTKSGKNMAGPLLFANLTAAFLAMRAKFPTLTMSPDQQKKAIYGTMKFVDVSKMKYVTAIKARDGFVRAHQVRPFGEVLERPISGHENSTVDCATPSLQPQRWTTLWLKQMK